jgi:hypothetical protein
MRVSPIMTREDLFKSSVEFDHFFIQRDSDVEHLRMLFDLYHGERFKNNYSFDTLNRLIEENRFADGVGVVYLNGEPVAFCGLSSFEQWTVITRYVVTKYFRMPWASGCLFPGVIEVAKMTTKEGVALTVNEDNMMLRDTLTGEKGTRYKGWRYDHIRDHWLFSVAVNQPQWIHVEHPVWYRQTKQYVAYIPFGSTQPPFQYYEKQKTAT